MVSVSKTSDLSCHDGSGSALDDALASVLLALESNEPLDRESLLAPFPEMREELNQFIENWLAVEQETGRIADANSSYASRQSAAMNGRVIGDYQLLETLGSGGMGVVYRARQISLGRTVAVKMVWNAVRDKIRFQIEADAAASLHHGNIVSIYEVGMFEGQPFLSMQFIDGGNLRERLQQGPLSPSAAATLVQTLSLAIHYAHQRGILHRDLKPANVLLDAEGKPFVTDFGLAKQMANSKEVTRSGAILGTPGYMSPEQAMGRVKSITVAADVYGLGAILYATLTGAAPFHADSDLITLRQVIEDSPSSPRSIRPEVDRNLENICLKCLEKQPASRYASARHLADDLERYLNGEPVLARPVGSLERAGRWCRRHPLSASLVAALMVVVATAFIAVWWQWKEAVAQQHLAETNAVKFQAERDRAITATTQAEANARETQYQRSLAETHLAAAESRFAKAQAPIQELVRLGVELVREPHMEARGRQALEKASQFRQALLEEKLDDPEARWVTASTFHTLAWTLLEHGEFTDAELTYGQALKILMDLHDQDPDSRRYLQLMRRVCLERGVALSHLNQHEAAEQSCRDSVLHAEKLVAGGPENARDQVGLGAALMNWSVTLAELGRHKEAVSAQQRSVDLQRAVASIHPDVNSYQTDLALALSGLASQLWRTDRTAAEAIAVESLEIRRTLVSRAVAPRDEAMYLISSLNQLTAWYTSVGRLEEAEQLLTEATERAQSARTAFPAFYGVRYRQVTTMAAAHRLAVKKGDAKRANDLVSELRHELAAALVDFPDDTDLQELEAWFRHKWGLLMAERGETEAAMTILTSSLHDLCRLQSESSLPEHLRSNITSVARRVLTVGTRFEFEREKIESAREWVAQNPDDPVALNGLAWRQSCVKDESLRDPVSAEQSIRHAIELRVDRATYHNTLGVALFYQNRLDEAIVEFNASLELKTTQPAADWYFLAMIHRRKNEVDAATELLDKAHAWHREHQPDDAELRLIQEEVER